MTACVSFLPSIMCLPLFLGLKQKAWWVYIIRLWLNRMAPVYFSFCLQTFCSNSFSIEKRHISVVFFFFFQVSLSWGRWAAVGKIMQALPLSVNWLSTEVWLLWKSIPLKDQKSFKIERQLEDYYKILSFICLEIECWDWGMWKIHQLSYFFLALVLFSFLLLNT